MRTLIISFALLILLSNSYSHPGGRDNNGGHVNRNTGTYHCHTDNCILPAEEETEEDVEDPPDGLENNSVTVAGSWGTTKKWARDTIYNGINETFYCGCTYQPSGTSGGEIDQASCDYDGGNESHAHRAGRLEWKHVVPASLMPARRFQCWNEGLNECSKSGRECCEKHDLNARVQIFDLHNLVPSIGQTNALRGNKRYGLMGKFVN